MLSCCCQLLGDVLGDKGSCTIWDGDLFSVATSPDLMTATVAMLYPSVDLGKALELLVVHNASMASDLTLSKSLALVCCSSGASVAAPHAVVSWESKGFSCSYSGHGELVATWFDWCQLGDLVNSRGDALI